MDYKNIGFLLLAVVFASCKQHNSKNYNTVKSDTLAYTYKTFKLRDSACGNNPDSACTVVKIQYPDFDGQTNLNDSVAAAFIKLFALPGNKPDTSLQQLGENFIGRYTAFKKDHPLSTLYFLLDAKAKVLRDDSGLLTIQTDGYAYHGGPHGVDYTGFVNWDTQANRSISLDDIFIAGYNNKLNRVAEKIFRKNEKISDTTPLNNGRTYFFTGNKFSLPGNFLLTPQGIQFLYNVYTIKAYAAGKTTLLVPYGEVDSLIATNGIVKQYIK